ncbi:type II CAAX endopeptidase family protein [Paenibacillus cucumis (ex Kampfer et al. 2016)]|uniref:CPBP family intramembrane glutamic endopeptidase n=1 Tax=Paenibacillus TaxID=44249 RepID=UPI001C8F0F0C|nr:type II CAAX endopeptidase family protein [Paenibacillus cucumis (ex Kampfer et al. 2016)]MDP9697481.1 membrane protease YdiL (CAAX protease family) [Paenibacillus intestini]
MSNRIGWNKKDFIGVSIIPIEILLGTVLGQFSLEKNQLLGITLSLGIFLTGFLVMIWLYKDFLSSQWKHYKQNKLWIKLFFNALLVLGAFGILSLTRSLMDKPLSVNDTYSLSNAMVSMMLIGSIQPFIAPFAEELTFRYLLFGKFNSTLLKLLMFFVSSILFGLIHINNFNGDWIQTIPYMIIGAYFAVIYLVYKNIWSNIIVHWIFNSINSIVPAITIVVMKLIGAV